MPEAAPGAVEPPSHIVSPYEPRIVGWLAFAWLVVFVAALAVSSAYETRAWLRSRR